MKLHPGRRAFLALFGIAVWAGPAQAIPELQLYIEGATYDLSTETWVTNSNNFKLWVIADVGAQGTIFDVHIAAAYLTSEAGIGTITLTPSTTALLTDPSQAAPAVLSGGGVGTRPVMDSGDLLPSHGIYGPGTSWSKYDIGNMDLLDSPVGDFQEGFPGSFPSTGMVSVYDVQVTGFSMVHFDAYNHIASRTRSLFAPPSHDAGGTPVPEPGSLLLLGIGIGSAAVMRMRRPKS